MREPSTMDSVAEEFFAAVVDGRLDEVRRLYAPDAVIWHNYDGVEQTAEENLRTLRWVVTTLRDLRYDDVRRSATATGFVQQHVLRATNPAGVAVELPACVVATVVDGRIGRLDEYLDSRHTDRLRASGATSS